MLETQMSLLPPRTVEELVEDIKKLTKEIQDFSGNENHATTAGSMTSADSVAGKLNTALEFDGTEVRRLDQVDLDAGPAARRVP